MHNYLIQNIPSFEIHLMSLNKKNKFIMEYNF